MRSAAKARRRAGFFAARRGAAALLALAPALLLLPLPRAARAAGAQDAIVGTWLTDEGDSKVEITATAAADGSAVVYNGKVSWLKEPLRDGKPLQDANNGDAALRARPILGLTILAGFRAAPGGGWAGGTIYSPRAGKSFPAEISLAADGRLQIKVRAGLVSRTVYWTR